MEKIYEYIKSGKFTKEWRSPLAHVKLKVICFLAMRWSINTIERYVRKAMRMTDVDISKVPMDIDDILKNPSI